MNATQVRRHSRALILSLAVLAFCMTASIPLHDGARPDPAAIVRPQAGLDLAVAIDAKCSGYVRYEDGSPFPDMPVYSTHWYGIDSTTSRWDGYYSLNLPWESDYIIFADKPGWQLSSYVELKWWEIYDGARYTWNPTAAWKGLIISGHLVDVRGAPLSGLEVRLSGDDEGVDLTDANGFYDFRNLDIGSYTVTPTAARWTFSPGARDVALLDSHKHNQDFVGRLSFRQIHVRHQEGGLVAVDVLPPETGTVTLRIVSPMGRVIWRTERPAVSSTAMTIGWAGRDDSGSRVAPGLYFATVTGAGCHAVEKVVVLR